MWPIYPNLWVNKISDVACLGLVFFWYMCTYDDISMRERERERERERVLHVMPPATRKFSQGALPFANVKALVNEELNPRDRLNTCVN